MICNYTYQQESKQRVRESVLKDIIRLLTYARGQASCIRNSYVRDLYEWFVSNDYDLKSKNIAKQLPLRYIDLWEDFHKSCIGYKQPKDLSVCYLSGSQPMNDFKVLVENGIHPHNIWAFEKDKKTYNNALSNIDKSDFPMLKIHKGSIEQFFYTTPKKFDIVYLDFCGAIPSSQNLTRIIASLMKYQRLNSPGALITNVASPDISKAIERDKYVQILTDYLYNKPYLENDSGYITVNSYNNRQELYDEINKKFNLFYSQFITRQIFDIATIITPWNRLAQSSYWGKYFKKKPTDIVRISGKGKNMPLSKTINSILSSKKFKQFNQRWLSELGGYPINSDINDIIHSYDVLKSDTKYYEDIMLNNINDYSYEDKMFQFCDKPSNNLAFDIVINQLTYPMHYVTKEVIRKSYVAKKTRMFTDAIIFDECRYIYEWLPTIDLLDNAFDDIGQQLTYRFALDGLVKSRMFYNCEYFFEGSVINTHEDKLFQASEMKHRVKIN